MSYFLWHNKLTNKIEILNILKHELRLKILEIFKNNDFNMLGKNDHLIFIKKIEIKVNQSILN